MMRRQGRLKRLLVSVAGTVLAAAGLMAGGTGTAAAVVGGTVASAGAYPYQVELWKRTSTGDWHPFCGGSIIGDRWILTAAHCAEATTAERMIVTAGSNTLDPAGTIYRVQEAVRHQDYNGDAAGSPNDIGLLKLSTPIAYTPLVQPIALPEPAAYPGGTATLTGWGRTSGNGEASNTLQQANVTVLTVAECQVRWSGQKINTNHVCTYDKGTGVSACLGDSGGPLAQNGRVIGIVSWGHSVCSGVYPSVHTNVAAYRSWITTKTGF
ncbi:serine protease [Streptomyces hydrogenans]|uniref:serine protease n=1 Tax=Streptomyces hydrogenans TaxID=1873719 RepID=UPI0035E1AFB3